MPKNDNPSGTKGRNLTRRAETPQATRNGPGKKSTRNKKKRRNPLEELAEKLNLSRSTIYLYARQRKIPCVRIGHRFVLPDDVEERIKALAYENWPPPDEKLQRRRKKKSDSENDS
jgi:excisionase family DNA binding protein